jgi:hypothetical protein
VKPLTWAIVLFAAACWIILAVMIAAVIYLRHVLAATARWLWAWIRLLLRKVLSSPFAVAKPLGLALRGFLLPRCLCSKLP